MEAVLMVDSMVGAAVRWVFIRKTPFTNSTHVSRNLDVQHVLISAQQTQAREGHGLIIDDVSEDLANQWNAIGAEAIVQGA